MVKRYVKLDVGEGFDASLVSVLAILSYQARPVNRPPAEMLPTALAHAPDEALPARPACIHTVLAIPRRAAFSAASPSPPASSLRRSPRPSPFPSAGAPAASSLAS